MPLADLVKGPRPDITPPQVAATVVAGIPIVASLLSAFGLYELSPEQQDAMGDAVTWAGVLAAALIGGDAAVRTARNRRKGGVEAILAEGGEADRLEIVRESRVPVVRAEPDATTYRGSGETGFEDEPPTRAM